ncbi:hypothetical protein ACFW9D_22700 [Streptomyces sp. NPDC059524]|uniref:hypothetical protein n=1 Tax=Streptomyces sp. NPDC059524 TaxID=3346856 RepID=UPI0036A2FB96
MSLRRITAVISTVAAALALSGCSGDDLFSNMNGTRAANSAAPAPASSRPPAGDAPPNYADNSRVRQPKDVATRDRAEAKHLAQEIQRVLETERERGRISPAEVRPALDALVAPRRLDVGILMVGTAPTVQEDGSEFGVFVGDTACVNGAVSKERVWVEISGHYPETGCMIPSPAH